MKRLLVAVSCVICPLTQVFGQQSTEASESSLMAHERTHDNFIDSLAEELPSLAKIHVPVKWGKSASAEVKETHKKASAIGNWFWDRQRAKDPAIMDSIRRIWYSTDRAIRAVWFLDGQGLEQFVLLLKQSMRSNQSIPAIQRFALASIEASAIKDRPEGAAQLRSAGHFLLAECAWTQNDTAQAIAEWFATARLPRTPWALAAAKRLLGIPSIQANAQQYVTVLTLAYLQEGLGKEKAQYFQALKTLYPKFTAAHGVSDDVIPGTIDDLPRLTSPLSLDAYLDRQFTVLYERAFPVERVTSSSNRVVVAEYKTGVKCSGCWTADRAFHAVNRRYAPSEVITLGYHGNYPIGNRADSLWRRLDAWYPSGYSRYMRFRGKYSAYLQAAQAYDTNGNPIGGSYWVNGQGMRSTDPESSIPTPQQRYDLAVHLIDSLRATAPKATLRLAVARNKDQVNVTVMIDSLAYPRSKVLRIVMFEDTVRIRGQTIRRLYENVVRGVAQTEDMSLAIPIPRESSTVAYTFDLNTIRKQLEQTRDPEWSARDPETGKVNELYRGFYQEDLEQFPDVRDWSMDETRLHVVAFIQETRKGEVLQAARAKVPSH